MSRQTILFGTNINQAQGDAARRQRRAAATLIDVSAAAPINLQFSDGADLCEIDGFETQPILQLDSNRVTGQRGPRKPIVSEMFTRLASRAIERGARYFGFSNGDILLTPTAVERVAATEHLAYVIARTDVDATGAPDPSPLLYGTDVFVIDASWWIAHQHRFRRMWSARRCGTTSTQRCSSAWLAGSC